MPTRVVAIDLLMGTFNRPGPRIDLVLREGGTRAVVAIGAVRAGWKEGAITIPLTFERRLNNVADAELCLRFKAGVRVEVAGEADGTPATIDGVAAGGKISLNARSDAERSVADLLPLFAEQIGRGNAGWIGPWTAYAIGLLLLVGVALGAIAVRRTDGFTSDSAPQDCRFLPFPARALTGAALAVGMAWVFLIPPFQVPDETSHVAYVQYVSEAGRLPIEASNIPPYSNEEREILGALGFSRIIGRPLEHVISSPASEDHLRQVERASLPRGAGNATTASSNPPLYYLLQAPVFLAASGGSLLTQLLAMRALSVLFMSASVLFAFLFVREMLPSSPWTWTAGGLACAFQPVLGFVGAGVNPDSLLFLCSAALFFGVARTLRCGLTTRRAVFVAIAVAAGLLTKPLFFALVPVAVVGLVLAAARQRRGWFRPCATALLVATAPVGLVAVIGAVVFDHPYFAVAASVASGAQNASGPASSFLGQASYVLQLFLPRLPFLIDQIPGVPPQDIWITGLVGVFGWVDYGFSLQDTILGVRVFLILLVLSAVALVRYRQALQAQWRLMLCCLVGLVCLPGAIGVIDYQAFVSGSARFEQARYLLPLLALYGGLFALATKAVGPRFGRLALPLLWTLVAFHSVAAFILTVNRYYL